MIVLYPIEGDTVPFEFDTFDGGTGASITMTGLAVTDIEIYKDGSVTQRASDSGYALLDTDGIDFDGLTGIHGFSIDLSDNTDAGFYTVGPWYTVVVSSVTVDAQTVNFIAGKFRILSATRGMAGTALPDAAADAAGGLPISDAGGLDLDTLNSNMTATLADTNELQTDWVNGGRLDLIVDAILDDTDLIDDGTSGLAKIATDVAAILVDTAVIGAAGAGLTAIPWNAAWDTEVQSECADALTAYDPPTNAEMEARTLPTASYFDASTDTVTVGAINSAGITDIWSTDTLVEAYATNGSAGTPAQLIYAIHQMLMQFGISGTSLTVKKLDNTTTAFVVTLSDATNPTGAVRT